MGNNGGVQPIMTNPGADRVRKIRALATASGRRRGRAFIVEGPQGVREAIRHAPHAVKDIYLTVDASVRYPEILDDAREQRLFLHLCAPEVIAEMSADAQGVLAVLNSRERNGAAYAEVGAAGGRFYAGLVEARDPGNAGAIIRAADAAGAGGVVLSVGSVDVENPKVVRSTAGSLFHLPVTYGGDPATMIGAAKSAGLQVLATTADGEHRLDLAGAPSPTGLDLAAPTLWLFGNEAHGLSPEALALADATVGIPIYGHAESLNLAMAATLCLYASASAHDGEGA